MVLNSINNPEIHVIFTHVKKKRYGIIHDGKTLFFNKIAGSDNNIYYIIRAKFNLVSA
jgi:hypothetical protein